MEWILYLLFRIVVVLLNALPYERRLAVTGGLASAVFRLLPHYRRIARKNLELAFPNQDAVWREQVMKESERSFARVMVDFIRMPSLPAAWAKEHIHFPQMERFLEIRRKSGGKGVILASGHLGSFELLPFCMVNLVAPMAIVIRAFKQPLLNRWWNGVRTEDGNSLIPRKGAMKEMIKTLNSGRDVGILFDQNVIRKHAVFVDCFGRPAATTKAMALAAIRVKTPILLFAIFPLGPDDYRIEMRDFSFDALYHTENLSVDEKALQITQEVTRAFEELVREHPEGWFWMHKRWKTTPSENIPEDFYS